MDQTLLYATARAHDESAGSGTVLLDDGTVLPYPASAFIAGGLRTLRSGQRVLLRVAPDGGISALTLATFELPPDDQS
jgi:cold shock CspA family protein